MYKKSIIEQQLGIPPDYQYKALLSRNFLHSNWHKNKLDTLEFLLKFKKSERILDLGIGSGNFEIYFSKYVKEIIGIDYNNEAIRFVRELLRKKGINNVRLYNDDIKKFGDRKNLGKFDFILLIDVIEHFELNEAKKVVRRIKRHLKDEGSICIITPNTKSTWIILEWILDKLNLAPEMGNKQHLSYFDAGNLDKILKDEGYTVDRISTFNTFSFLSPIQLLRKKINKLEVEKFKYGNLLAVVAKK
ncbi:MAG: Methyltransferase type 11 [Microgenomates group bacterium GW2011_GWC1_37_8]|uniref:Methyltransferase domain-containing protein n=1 Tax=Candidatus Woesebacteria bacterium GW2011_GWB1_38_8 TaxID=1618570 RepID=A0A0G0LCY4_9BACT|nr:MAG: Methyltransferase type 11 [Microgenomates group bacterium GW2011_GWC1_37_8]KKQ85755.1 MAG: hypothetical protein UT08_C0004G0067 [Candidatus Woesebacteria bacterium GW2011_GWB1_38_8]